MKPKFLIFCCITIGIAVMIFYLSSQPASTSSEVSNVFVEKIIETVLQTATPREVELLTFLVRKAAHFTEYLLLALFLGLTLRERPNALPKSIQNRRSPSTQKKAEALLCFLICTLYACSDEIHQHFVPGRSGEIRDVLIDAAGAFLGILLLSLYDRHSSRRTAAR